MTSDRAPSSRTVTPPPETSAMAKSTIEGKQQPDTAVVDPEKKPAAPGPAFTFPDGGWKAWSTVAGAWLVLFVSFGYVNAFGEPHQSPMSYPCTRSGMRSSPTHMLTPRQSQVSTKSTINSITYQKSLASIYRKLSELSRRAVFFLIYFSTRQMDWLVPALSHVWFVCDYGQAPR